MLKLCIWYREEKQQNQIRSFPVFLSVALQLRYSCPRVSDFNFVMRCLEFCFTAYLPSFRAKPFWYSGLVAHYAESKWLSQLPTSFSHFLFCFIAVVASLCNMISVYKLEHSSWRISLLQNKDYASPLGDSDGEHFREVPTLPNTPQLTHTHTHTAGQNVPLLVQRIDVDARSNTTKPLASPGASCHY